MSARGRYSPMACHALASFRRWTASISPSATRASSSRPCLAVSPARRSSPARARPCSPPIEGIALVGTACHTPPLLQRRDVGRQIRGLGAGQRHVGHLGCGASRKKAIVRSLKRASARRSETASPRSPSALLGRHDVATGAPASRQALAVERVSGERRRCRPGHRRQGQEKRTVHRLHPRAQRLIMRRGRGARIDPDQAFAVAFAYERFAAPY